MSEATHAPEQELNITESEPASDVSKAADWLKNELEKLDYVEDKASEVSKVFRRILELMLNSEKLLSPQEAAEALLEDYKKLDL